VPREGHQHWGFGCFRVSHGRQVVSHCALDVSEVGQGEGSVEIGHRKISRFSGVADGEHAIEESHRFGWFTRAKQKRPPLPSSHRFDAPPINAVKLLRNVHRPIEQSQSCREVPAAR
jgi:hypothetical protein